MLGDRAGPGWRRRRHVQVAFFCILAGVEAGAAASALGRRFPALWPGHGRTGLFRVVKAFVRSVILAMGLVRILLTVAPSGFASPVQGMFVGMAMAPVGFIHWCVNSCTGGSPSFVIHSDSRCYQR